MKEIMVMSCPILNIGRNERSEQIIRNLNNSINDGWDIIHMNSFATSNGIEFTFILQTEE